MRLCILDMRLILTILEEEMIIITQELNVALWYFAFKLPTLQRSSEKALGINELLHRETPRPYCLRHAHGTFYGCFLYRALKEGVGTENVTYTKNRIPYRATHMSNTVYRHDAQEHLPCRLFVFHVPLLITPPFFSTNKCGSLHL